MRIGVTYDLKSDYLAQGWSAEDAAEFDSDVTISAICDALAAMGLEPVRIGTVKRLAERLVAGERWDGVFNFCEGIKGVGREAQVPALLEAYDIPYVFSDTLTLAVSLDKAMCKRIVRDAGVPTPDFAVIETLDDVAGIDLPYPLFLKPVAEGSGKGVDRNSRVTDPAGLKITAADLLDRFHQPVLVETFLPGREFTVGITGTGAEAEVLGVTEIVPKAGYVGAGYGYENKLEGWEDKLEIAPAPPDYAQSSGAVALAAWRALRCRDGGRIDVRCDAGGAPQFIEVNPLAGLRPAHSDLCLIADFAGITYQDLIARIMASFFRRTGQLARPARGNGSGPAEPSAVRSAAARRDTSPVGGGGQ